MGPASSFKPTSNAKLYESPRDLANVGYKVRYPDRTDLRWKSQRKKIHRLAYRFSIDFKIHRLAYGFLCVNHKGLAKVYRFLVRVFFLRFLKIHRLVWIFLWIFGCYGSVSSMFHFDLYKYSLY